MASNIVQQTGQRVGGAADKFRVNLYSFAAHSYISFNVGLRGRLHGLFSSRGITGRGR
jgi:hypothetical protein